VISEPVTLVTDYLLAILTLFLAWRLHALAHLVGTRVPRLGSGARELRDR
jgi:hypothetical protein